MYRTAVPHMGRRSAAALRGIELGIIQPSPWRFTVQDCADRRIVIIPAERELGALIFISIWLIGWAAGEVAGISHFPSHGDFLMATWLAGWSVAGIAVIAWWIWLIAGVETITIDSASFNYQRGLLGLSHTRTFLVESARCLRVIRGPDRNGLSSSFYLAFDYGARTVRFARRRNAAELEQIAMAMAVRHSSIVKKPEGNSFSG